jgi:L-aspartate oxidase
MIKTDILVLGSGIAGLTFSLKIAQQFSHYKVTILTKSNASESNTKYAQGGMAVVVDFEDDSFDKHIQDTLKAGDGFCDVEVVEMVVKEGPQCLKELIEWGARLDATGDGELDLAKEGGHTQHRIVHHKDITGFEMERALLKQIHKQPNIELLTHHYAIDLITEHHLFQLDFDKNNINCFGAYALNANTNKIETFVSKITMLATGGSGQVYSTTTNPTIATGDGVAMAYRAKAKIADMEFIQFHPTALYQPDVSPAFLISEAVRGFGAYLVNHENKRFVFKYDERGELASRDIVAKAINSELIKSGEDNVFLDCRHLDMQGFKAHFPNIYERCLKLGIDVAKDLIPVVPAAHYQCGGIWVNKEGRTTIHQLYACGECSRTGLHGANRLASNSLLEALVYAQRAYLDVCEVIDHIELRNDAPSWDASGTSKPKEKVLLTHSRKELQRIMNDYVSIVRSDERLLMAQKRLDMLYDEIRTLYQKTSISPQLCELRNLIAIAHLIVHSSLQRKENKGAFYKLDNVA